jgi:hypothetical protein
VDNTLLFQVDHITEVPGDERVKIGDRRKGNVPGVVPLFLILFIEKSTEDRRVNVKPIGH